MLQAVRLACGFAVSYDTFRRWMFYYHKYGEVPANSRRHRPSIKQIRMTNCRIFKKEHLDELKRIITEQPALYLDEIQHELYKETGVMWASSTIWRKIQKLGYSLQVAVYRARQQKAEEVALYYVRLNDRVDHPRQVLIIDETARGEKASRKRRALSPRGVTPILVAPMVQDHGK